VARPGLAPVEPFTECELPSQPVIWPSTCHLKPTQVTFAQSYWILLTLKHSTLCKTVRTALKTIKMMSEKNNVGFETSIFQF